MEKQEINSIVKQCLDYIDQGTTAMADEALQVNIDTYRNDELFELEKEHLFRRHPQMICLSSDLSGPGRFVTNDDTGVPIVVVRDESGTANAFLNACRHRGARLIDKKYGYLKGSFSCPYHAWRYAYDGELISVFHENTVGELDKSCLNLIALPVEEKYGFVYVNPDPEGKVNIDDLLGDLGPQLAGWNINDTSLVKWQDLPVDTNWKLAMDTFCEGYHFGPLHPETVGMGAITNVMTYDQYNRCHRLGFPAKSITELKQQPEEDWDGLAHINFVHFLFPNITLFVSPDWVYVFQLYPGDKVDQHLTRYHLYSRKPLDTDDQKQEAQEHFDFIFGVVEKEDYWVSRNVMKSFNSSLHPYSIFGRNEVSLINMHKAFREAVGLDASGILWEGKNTA